VSTRATRRLLIGVVAVVIAVVVPIVLVVTHGSSHPRTSRVAEPPGGVFGPTSIWHMKVSGAPVASRSPAMVSTLSKQVATRFGGVAAFNVYRYGMSWYTVPATQPKVTVRFSNCEHDSALPKGLYGTDGQFVGVPIPDNAVPTGGTDGEVSIYQPATDTLWDFWRAYRDGAGWHACWGGRLDNVSSSLGYFPLPFGMTATGIASEAGAVSIADVRSGVIDHAVSLGILDPAISSDFSWPAQRSDGSSRDPSAIPEGSRLRLNPSINVGRLGLSRIGTMIAKAAQTYGFIVTDRAGTASVPAESPSATMTAIGSNPWTDLLGGVKTYQVMKGFPWGQLQVLPKNWGRPPGVR
jgi:hypothetical protein